MCWIRIDINVRTCLLTFLIPVRYVPNREKEYMTSLSVCIDNRPHDDRLSCEKFQIAIYL